MYSTKEKEQRKIKEGGKTYEVVNQELLRNEMWMVANSGCNAGNILKECEDGLYQVFESDGESLKHIRLGEQIMEKGISLNIFQEVK